MRIGFVTCVRLGLSCMEALCGAGATLQLAITLRDELARQKSGRVYVDEFCARHAVPLVKIHDVNDADSVAAIAGASLDWLFIVGWSQIARGAVLTAPRCGVFGMHPTLLPEGRGRAAVPWAILKGLTRTGVTLFKLDAGVDSGPVAAQVVVPVESRETATTLYRKIEDAHRTLLVDAWPVIRSGTITLVPQDIARASVWPGRKPDDGRIADTLPVAEAERLVRAVTHPYPGAFVDAPGGRLRIWAVTPRPGERCSGVEKLGDGRWIVPCGDGTLVVEDGELELPARSAP